VSAVRGKPHAAFEAAGAGNVAWSKYWDTRNRKGEQQGIQTSTYTGAPVLDPTIVAGVMGKTRSSQTDCVNTVQQR
jgi:hypothetical protein